jgi:fido (protein-threonine AMPylation protein)
MSETYRSILNTSWKQLWNSYQNKQLPLYNSKTIGKYMIQSKKNKLNMKLHVENQKLFESLNITNETIKDGIEKLKKSENNSVSECIGLYTREIWVSEQDVSDTHDTWNIVDLVIEKKYEEAKEILKSVNPNVNQDRTLNKVKNLVNTCQHLFASDTNSESKDVSDMCVDFVLDVHKRIMDDLLPKEFCGNFRTCQVGTANHTYCSADFVEQRLQVLISFVNEKKKKTNGIIDMIVLGSFFLEKFLDVHPFKNGNGRTGRIIFSWLLRLHSVVPLSLYLPYSRRMGIFVDLAVFQNNEGDDINPRSLYIDSLVTSRVSYPEVFARYCLECVSSFLSDYNFNFVMDAE